MKWNFPSISVYLIHETGMDQNQLTRFGGTNIRLPLTAGVNWLELRAILFFGGRSSDHEYLEDHPTEKVVTKPGDRKCPYFVAYAW